MPTYQRCVLFLSLAILAQPTWANPIISLAGQKQFQSAINSKRLTGFGQPGNNAARNLAALNKTYPGQAANFKPTRLKTVSLPASGLLDKTGTAANLTQKVIGAYAYNYGADPDMTDLFIKLDLYIPEVGDGMTSGIDTIGIAIVDRSSRIKFWSFNNTTLSTGLNEFKLNFADGAGAGGSTGFGEDAGFDITDVDTLQVNQDALLGSSFPPTPDDGETAAWKITTRLLVAQVPEPSAAAMIGAGVAIFGIVLRRRSRA